MKSFKIPKYYKSNLIKEIKNIRKELDPKRKNFQPSILKFKNINIILPRHFGFCYGVENAIEITYNIIEKYPNKKIYLLSEMIHNPQVNDNLKKNGVKFIRTTKGDQLISWDKINSNDIVIIPAFGTTKEIMSVLRDKNINYIKYDTTCPFVKKVWKKSEDLSKENYTIIIHGKHYHEETQATFSHAKNNSCVIIRDMKEAEMLAKKINNTISNNDFLKYFKNKTSVNFDPTKDLKKIGVVNQTTMIAEETQAISKYLKNIMRKKYKDNIENHFAETRDTLCYATNENQKAIKEALKYKIDISFIIGGFNSSNTINITKLCEQKSPSFLIKSDKFVSEKEIEYYNLKKEKTEKILFQYKNKIQNIIITSGASCPDNLMEDLIKKILKIFQEKLKDKNIYNEIKKQFK